MKMRKYIFLIIFVGLLVYFSSFFNGFLWDDEEFIVNNPAVHSLKNIPLSFKSSAVNGSYYRPVMSLITTTMYVISGGHPWLFRLFQVGVHLVNSILIFLLFCQFFPMEKLVSFLLSLVFLVHPINSEAVSFISATQETLFFLFGVSGLLFLIKRKKDLKNLFLVSALIFLSLLTKETGIVFFIIAAGYLYYYNRKDLLNFIVINNLFFFVYFLQRLVIGATYVQGKGLFPIMRVSFVQRLLTIPKIILFYLEKFFFPGKLAIAQHWLVLSPNLADFYLPLLIDLLFFFLLIFVALKIKDKGFNFFFFWFLSGLLPHLQIIPLNMTVAERWLYLPIVGLLGMIGVILKRELDRIPKRLALTLIIVILVLFSLRTIARNFDWRNELSLFSHDAKRTISFDLENNLGVALFRSGKIQEAEKHFKKSTELAPYWWVNWNNLGVIYERKGRLAEAEKLYKKAIDQGEYYLAYENYVGVLIKEKKLKEAKEFLEKEALIKLPNNEKLKMFYHYLLQN